MDSGYLAPGALLKGRYEIVREIGRGGYSVVYLARDREVESEVAIKLLVPPPASARLARDRLRREVQAVRGLAHAQIVGVHDFLEDGAWSFVVMDYVDGSDLAVRVRERGVLDPEDAARVGCDVAEALRAAHARGILHRDVKPQNILLDRTGAARLADFGAARLDGQASMTQTGALVGTLAYIAPEVMAGGRSDARSDLYALGITLYYALVGRLPDRVSPHVPPTPAPDGYHPRIERPDVPVWLDAIVAHATVADPGHRYHSAQELGEALLARKADEPTLALRGPAALDFCLACGSTNASGLTACPDCRGLASGRADTLVYVDPPADLPARRALAASLEQMLAGVPHAPDVVNAARGARALLRVTTPSAGAVLEQLRLRRIPVRAVPVGRAWPMVPVSLYALLSLILLTGTLASGASLPTLGVTTPLLVGLMLLSAHRAVQQPLLNQRTRRSALPAPLDRKVVETLSRLPAGAARSLLGDLARLTERAYPAAGRAAEPAAPAADLAELLSRGCEVASDLAGLDESLHVLERRRDEGDGAVGAWTESLASCERARDRLVQQLLDAITAVGRVRGRTAPDGALGELARVMAERAQLEEGAMQEVEALLAGKGPTSRVSST